MYTYYLFEPGGAKLPHTLKNLKMHMKLMELTENEVSNTKFEN